MTQEIKCSFEHCKLKALFAVSGRQVCRSHLPRVVMENVDDDLGVRVQVLETPSVDYMRGFAAGRREALKQLKASEQAEDPYS
jgi:hypothetical protein